MTRPCFPQEKQEPDHTACFRRIVFLFETLLCMGQAFLLSQKTSNRTLTHIPIIILQFLSEAPYCLKLLQEALSRPSMTLRTKRTIMSILFYVYSWLLIFIIWYSAFYGIYSLFVSRHDCISISIFYISEWIAIISAFPPS